MNKWVLLFCVSVLPPISAQEKANTVGDSSLSSTEGTDAPMSVWMAKKLKYSEELLKALTSGDFEAIKQTGERMRLIGKVEGFVRNQNPDYANHLKTFDLANRELIRQAKRENIEGALLAFHQLTSSCVACHVDLRVAESKPLHVDP